MGSLQFVTALALDDTFEASEGKEGKLIPLTIVTECVRACGPLMGQYGTKLLQPDEVKVKFGAFVQNRDILDSYDVFLS